MPSGPLQDQAAGEASRRLFPYNAGMLPGWPGASGLRRILQAAGWSLHLGRPGPGDRVVVWGRSSYAARGEAMAARHGVGLVRLEDAFLRSIHPGRAGGGAPLAAAADSLSAALDLLAVWVER